MGEIIVKGYAERNVECDVVNYLFKFIGDGISIPEAVEKSSCELERFLKVMEENNIDLKCFELADNTTSTKYRSENEKNPYESRRAVSVKMPISTQNADAIMQYIVKYQINVEIMDTYYYSHKSELHKELLKEAVDDSREKAKMIALCAGQKIKGIKSVNADVSDCDKYIVFDKWEADFEMKPCSVSRAQKISAPTRKEKEEVEVIWLIDD